MLICTFFSLSTLVIAGLLIEDSLWALVHLSTHSLINFYLEDEGEVESVLKSVLKSVVSQEGTRQTGHCNGC